MKLLDASLANDLERSASASFFIAAFELDEGTLFISDGISAIGSDMVCPAADRIDQNGFNIETQALPEHFAGARWINREVAILECTADMGSVYDGSILFDGIVASEPADTDGKLAITLALPSERVAMLPDYGAVDADRYPRASTADSGQILPIVIGTVEDCPLLAVSVTAATTLQNAALPDDRALTVADATAFPPYGAVWVDDESVFYSSHSDSELLGCTVKKAHAAGTAVVFAGEHVYQAAGNPCRGITDIKGGGAAFVADSFDTDRVIFAAAPLAQVAATRSNVLLQFDSVATSAFTQAVNVVYEHGDTIKPIETYSSADSGAVTAVGKYALTGSAGVKTSGSLSVVPTYTTTGVQVLPNGKKWSAIYYHPPTGGAFFGSSYADETTFARYVFTLTSSQVLDIPVGANATITLTFSESALDQNIVPVVAYNSGFAINGAPVTSNSINLTPTGTVTFTSTITMVMCATNHSQAVLALVNGISKNFHRTIDQIMSGFYGVRADIRYGYLIASGIKAEWQA